MKAFLLIISLISVGCYSQNPNSYGPIIPLTPNAASLGKFGDTQIGLYTGQPNISIPLYSINYPTLTVPISLTYSYSGLKVEEYPSWVGTGWTLNATGVITRQTRSLMDESINGFNGQTQKGQAVNAYITDYLATQGNLNPDWPAFYTRNQAFLTGVKDGNYDTEPDMFVFHFPGGSGKFFFDQTQCGTVDKIAIPIPHQNLKIKAHFNYSAVHSTKIGAIENFEITDEKGNIFVFSVLEEGAAERLEIDGGTVSESFGNAWYLSSIRDPFNNRITYQYGSRMMDNPPTVREDIIVPYEPVRGPAKYYKSKASEAILQKITFRAGGGGSTDNIEFIESVAVRDDWNSALWYPLPDAPAERPKSLAGIKITINNQLIKEYEFTYSYFGDNARLRLDKVQEKNETLTKPPYRFSYNNWYKFPRIGNKEDIFSQDHWGFYTGVINETLLPPYYNTLTDGTPIIINGNFRTPNPDAAAAGMLTNIEYPTGGFTSFEYEPNDYYGGPPQGVESFNPCAGTFQKVKENQVTLDRNTIYAPSGDVFLQDKEVSVIYTVTEPTCARISVALSISGCNESEAYAVLRSTNSLSLNYVSVRWNLSQGFVSDGLYGSNEIFPLPAGEYELMVRVEDPVVCTTNKTNRAYISLETTQSGSGEYGPGNRTAGGMRVAKLTDCPAGPCSGCISKYFSYKDIYSPTNSSGVLINAPIYFYPQAYLINPVSGPPVVGQGQAITASSLVPIASAQGSTIGYNYVTVREESDDAKGETIYRFTTASGYPDVGSVKYPFPPRIDNDWRRGVQVSRLDYAMKAGVKSIISDQQKILSFFTTYTNGNAPIGLKFGNKLVNLDFPGIPYVLTDYWFEPYSIDVGWTGVGQQVNISYEGTKEFRTTTSNTYGQNHLQVVKSDFIDSEGRLLSTTFKYKDDAASVVGLTLTELTGILACPDKTAVIEQQQLRQTSLSSSSTSVVSTTRSIYSGAELKKVMSSLESNPLEDMVTILSYDSYGNVLSLLNREGIKKSYIYGYNSVYPIAEVINATHTDIFATGFEETGTFFLNAHSGVRVSDGASFIFPVSFTPGNLPNMVMTYWYWNGTTWNFSGEVPYTTTITTPGTKIDQVRAYPKGALMTTYAYDPGVGVISKTDVNNITEFYEYDDLGRVTAIRDDKGKVLKTFEYHYKREGQ